MQDFIVFGRPKLSPEHMEAVQEVLEGGWIGRGPRVSQFENKLKEYLGVPHVLAVNSCTSALHLAAVCLGLGPKDEVLVPALTFAATANAILYTGAKVRLVDCAPSGACIDPSALQISENTKAIVAVHMNGERCDVGTLSQTGLKIIEDAAHAFELGGLGVQSDAVCYSFYPSKNITTIEGGALTSRHGELVERARVLSQHGLSSDAWTRYSEAGFKHYYVTELGYKYNMTDVQAAIGLVELEKVNEYRARRQRLWNFYQAELSDLGFVLPPPASRQHALHLFGLRMPENEFSISRDEFVHALGQAKIGCGIHYLSLAEHPYYQRTLGVNPNVCPNAFRYGRESFSIPFSQYVTDAQAEYICSTIRTLAKKHRRLAQRPSPAAQLTLAVSAASASDLMMDMAAFSLLNRPL